MKPQAILASSELDREFRPGKFLSVSRVTWKHLRNQLRFQRDWSDLQVTRPLWKSWAETDEAVWSAAENVS
ncbi:MAG: hypothetical protein AB7O38_23950 [Pirellulaceae bacterium]